MRRLVKWHRCHFLRTKLGYIGELPEGTKKAIYNLFWHILGEICKKTNKHRLTKKCVKLVSGDRLVGAKHSVGQRGVGGQLRQVKRLVANGFADGHQLLRGMGFSTKVLQQIVQCPE